MAETERLHELQQKFNDNPRRYFAPLANEYRKWGQYERAAELCRTYLPHLPGHMSGYIVYGQTLFDSGKVDESDSIFREALDIDPENVIALRHLGDISRINGNAPSAIEWYEKVLELDPKNDEIAAYIEELNVSVTAEIPIPEEAPYPEHEEEAGQQEYKEEPVAPPEEDPEPIEDLQFVPAYQEESVAPPKVAEPAADSESPVAPAAPFVTETLAAVYMDQGLYREALEVYRQLFEVNPDGRTAEKIAELELRLAAENEPEEIQFLAESDEVDHSEVTFETPEMTVTEFFNMIGSVQVDEEPTEDKPQA